MLLIKWKSLYAIKTMLNIIQINKFKTKNKSAHTKNISIVLNIKKSYIYYKIQNKNIKKYYWRDNKKIYNNIWKKKLKLYHSTKIILYWTFNKIYLLYILTSQFCFWIWLNFGEKFFLFPFFFFEKLAYTLIILWIYHIMPYDCNFDENISRILLLPIYFFEFDILQLI